MRLDVIFHQQPLPLAAPSSSPPKASHLSSTGTVPSPTHGECIFEVKPTTGDTYLGVRTVTTVSLTTLSGSTYILCIMKVVSDFFNVKEPNKSINPVRLPLMVLLSKLLFFPVTPSEREGRYDTTSSFDTKRKRCNI
jgi:hypothetical protein